MNLQVAEVNETFGSVAEFVDAGSKVVSQKEAPYIEAPHGRRIGLRRGRGM